MEASVTTAGEGYYFPISPLVLFPETMGRFGVYLKLGDSYILYAHPEEPFSQAQRDKLYANGVTELFVLSRQRRLFEDYLEENLGGVLADESLPLAERSKVFYQVSAGIVRDAFHARLPEGLDPGRLQRLLDFVDEGSRFLARKGSFKNVAQLISHDYKTYSHCVHVFVYTVAMLQNLNLPHEEIVQWGLGAILHDLGKVQVPRKILYKRGPLTKAEMEVVKTHPVKGAAVCARAKLSHQAVNAILFHHEKIDGSGYPAGMVDALIPLPVKVVTVADVYDALTSERPYAKAISPFQALVTMRDQMPGHFHPEAFRALVDVLAGNQLTPIPDPD